MVLVLICDQDNVDSTPCFICCWAVQEGLSGMEVHKKLWEEAANVAGSYWPDEYSRLYDVMLSQKIT